MTRTNGVLGDWAFDGLAWGARTLGGVAPVRRALADRLERRLRSRAERPAAQLPHPPAAEQDKAALGLALLQVAERGLAERRLGRPAIRALLKTLFTDVLVHRGDLSAKDRFRARHREEICQAQCPDRCATCSTSSLDAMSITASKKPVSELVEGEEQTIVGTIWQARVAVLGNRQGTEAIVGDETGNIRAVWFNQPYLARSFRTNTRMALSGTVGLFKGQKVFESPEWELLGDKELIHTARLVPVYPLTRGLYPRQVRKWTKEIVDGFAWQLSDFLPSEIKTRCEMLDLSTAIAQIHYPDDPAMAARARGWLQQGGRQHASQFIHGRSVSQGFAQVAVREQRAL